MKKRSITPSRGRMIHIRLDEQTHKRLKLAAVHQDTTVQRLVEELILKNIKSRAQRTGDNDRPR